MTPDYRVIADNKDITALIRDRLVELRVTDEEGMSSDAVEIQLDDRDNAIALPRKGAKLRVSLGYLGSALADMGLYTVDEVVPSGPPDILTLRAKAADLQQGLKSPKSRSWDNVTLGALVAKIAAEHGYIPQVAASLAAIALGHIDQTEESDLNLLTRLAQQYGATVKPAAGILLFVAAGQAKSASGKSMPRVALRRGDLSRWEATLADRGKYAAVTARYRDVGAAVDVEVTAGSGTPAYVLRQSYPSKEVAEAAAKAALKQLARGTGTVSFACAGDTRLAAEGEATISEVRDGVNGLWALTRVTHVVSAGGYRCDCAGKTPAVEV